jgi:hypothetical protein
MGPLIHDAVHTSVPRLSVSPQTPLVWRAVTSWPLLKIVTSWCRKSLLLLICMMHRETRAGTTLAIALRGPNDGVHFRGTLSRSTGMCSGS